MEELSNEDLTKELEKVRRGMSTENRLHAYEDAVIIQATKRIEEYDRERKRKISPKLDKEKELRNLLVSSIKELGEIAECIIKKDRPGHWKNELGDLCALGIRPMLKLAGMEFNYACELGLNRKLKKTQKAEPELIIKTDNAKCPNCSSVNLRYLTFTPNSVIYRCGDCSKNVEVKNLKESI